MNRLRDNQRNRVYTAEEQAYKRGCIGIDFRNNQEIQNYLDELISYPWFQSKFRKKRINSLVVSPNSRLITARAYYSEYSIIIPKCYYFEEVVLHEVAHLLRPKNAPHGREFCAILLYLVRHKMGEGNETELRTAFEATRVSYTWNIPERKRRQGATSRSMVSV